MAIFTPGAKYIKISRYDTNGNDNYLSLYQLNNIRVNTSDRGVIDYPVIGSPTVYPTYFLYLIATTDITSSINNQILNYRVSASTKSPPFAVPTLSPYVTPDKPNNYQILTGSKEFGGPISSNNPLGYFSATTSQILYQNTSNIPLAFTASLSYTIGGTNKHVPGIAFIQGAGPMSNRTIITYASTGSDGNPLNSNGILRISGSFTPIENESYCIAVGNFYTSGDNYSANVSFLITQSYSPITGISASTVLSPYIETIPFVNSDYDVLINNVIVNRPNNSDIVVADYISDQVIPVNYQAIMSGSAIPASTPDSNYTTLRIINPRYNGSENTSDNYNISNSGSNIPASIDVYDTCIYEFDWMGGGYPEYVNGGTVSLGNILIVNSENSVNVIQPSNPAYPFIVEANLPEGTTIYPTPYAPGGKLGTQLSVVYNRAEIPALATYAISSSGATVIGTASFSKSRFEFEDETRALYQVTLDSNNNYTMGSTVSAYAAIMYPFSSYGGISASLASGEWRWFMSFYQNLPITITGSLSQAVSGSFIPPIEITFATSSLPGASGFAYFNLSKDYDWSLLDGIKIGGAGNYGALIWPSPINSYRLIVSGSDSTSFSGIQNGAFTTQFPSPTIIENFQTITKTYGSNKT